MCVLQLFTFSLIFGHFEPLVQGAFTIGFRVQGVISENGHGGVQGGCLRSSSSSQVPSDPLGPSGSVYALLAPPVQIFEITF